MAHPLVLQIRGLFVAPPGKVLAIADASAIEARVLAGQAGQYDLVEKFRNGKEIYCGFASKVLGYPVRKPRKSGGIPAIEQRMGWARNSIGKVGILGCGYGMGAAKAVDYAQGAITAEQAEKIVTTYRAENQAIVQFWKDIEKAFIYTAKYKRSTALRGLRFDSYPDVDVVITLPNGRELKYHSVRMSSGKFNNETAEVYNGMERKWEYTWGGALTENVIQAESRDILMEASIRAADRGIRTALRVHDELVAVVDADQGETALAIYIEELSRPPIWAPNFALAAEGKTSDRYGSH